MDQVKRILFEQDIDVGVVDKTFYDTDYLISQQFATNLSNKDEIDYLIRNKVKKKAFEKFAFRSFFTR